MKTSRKTLLKGNKDGARLISYRAKIYPVIIEDRRGPPRPAHFETSEDQLVDHYGRLRCCQQGGETPFDGSTRDPRRRIAAAAQIALIHRGRHPVGVEEPPNSSRPRTFSPVRKRCLKRRLRFRPARHIAPASVRSSRGGGADPRIAVRGKTRNLVKGATANFSPASKRLRWYYIASEL